MASRAHLIAIATLASCALDGDAPDAITNPDMAEAMKEAKKRRGEKALESTVEVLEQALEIREQAILGARRSIRSYRKAIEAEKARMDNIDRALAYGNETSNFVPLMLALGMAYRPHEFELSRDEFEALSKVPEDWQPKAAE